jgi:sorting nexin-4
MAVIDQDNFSSISWHSDQNMRVGSSTSAEHEGHDEEGGGSKSQQGDVVDRAGLPRRDPSHGGDEILECTVTDPHTENAGTKDAYVSYLITTHVSLSSFLAPMP